MKSLDLNLTFSNTTRTKIDSMLLKKMAADFLQKMRLSGHLELDLSIVGSAKMRALNHQYRSVNKPTDVLSFPLTNINFASPKISRVKPLGSIVICPIVVAHHLRHSIYPSLNKNSQMTVNQGILYVMAHGLMHLLEYDHRSDTSEAEFDKIIHSFFKHYYAYS